MLPSRSTSTGFSFLTIVVLATLALHGAVATPKDLTSCTNGGEFTLDTFDVQGCDSSSICKIHAGRTYQVLISGCYNGTVANITNIPYSATAGAREFPDLGIVPIANGDLCGSFTADSPVKSCPVTVPQPDGIACGTWLFNVKAPLVDLSGTGLALGVPLHASLQAAAWLNSKLINPVPVYCVEFPIDYYPF